ncbi:MAG: DUF2892 domain-containing protein [Candidatus Dadabacteria bacterium]
MNLGAMDRLIRLLIGTFSLVLVYVRDFESPINYVLSIIGLFLVISACAGICPCYKVLGISTAAHNTTKPQT